MGYGHLKIGRDYLGAPFCFESFHHGQAVTTLPSGASTDSATSGTALATGYQNPENGLIGSDSDGVPVKSILEIAREAGMKCGIVTTDDIGGATPGAFGAHEPSRNNVEEIRLDYVAADTTEGREHPASLPDVLLGGGRAGGSAYRAVAAQAGYSYVGDVTALALTAEFARPSSSASATEPHLSEMVVAALDRVHPNDDRGFFLMIESALIDKISHDGTIDRRAYLEAELAEFDRAVQVAIAWDLLHPEDETLILVTADHETGISLRTTGNWYYAGTSHTKNNVPIFTNHDVGIGGTVIDNTDTFAVMWNFLFPPPEPPSAVTVARNAGQLTLRWNPSPEAIGYQVKRSTTSGGPYAPIATTETTSFVAATAGAGSSYYAVVAAFNAMGEAAESTEVKADPAGPAPRAARGPRINKRGAQLN